MTGGNGFVGRALCAALPRHGLDARAAVRQEIATAKVAVDQVVVDNLDDHTDWSHALTDVTVVVHLAARVHVMDDRVADPLSAFRQVNVQGTLNLARQAAAAGVRRFVFVSSVKVNGEETAPGHAFVETDPPAPQDPYGLSKWEAEQGLWEISDQSGMEVVVVRPPLVYGPGVKANFAALVRAVQRGWPLPLAAVDNRRSLVALANLVDFLALVCTHPKAAQETFLISDAQDVSMADLVREIGYAAHKPAKLLYIPTKIMVHACTLMGKKQAIQRLCGNLQVDSSKAHRLLDWVPVVTLKQGLRSVLDDKNGL